MELTHKCEYEFDGGGCVICGKTVVEQERSLAAPICSPTRQASPVTIDNDDLRAIENLAWMVKKSKQNVGLRMLDAADSVIRILKSKKP